MAFYILDTDHLSLYSRRNTVLIDDKNILTQDPNLKDSTNIL